MPSDKHAWCDNVHVMCKEMNTTFNYLPTHRGLDSENKQKRSFPRIFMKQLTECAEHDGNHGRIYDNNGNYWYCGLNDGNGMSYEYILRPPKLIWVSRSLATPCIAK